MTELSIIIPSRNEMFLGKTIEDLLLHIKGDTEIIAVLDGYEVEIPAIPSDPRLTIISHSESIGQRAAANEACKLSKAKYIAKADAHCAFDDGFDVKMLEMIKGHDDWTVVPVMKNLHAFDWVCPSGHRRYQSPSGPCKECSQGTTMDITWEPKRSPNSVSYCFDPEPHFQYFGDWSKRPEGQTNPSETMSLQGSFFMLTRDKYWELNICDEAFGSWGSQGIEVAVKTWLSGGRVMCNHDTWYAHMFRTQGGDFGFPYHLSGNQVQNAKRKAHDLFFNNKWEKQIHPISWLVEKFWPVNKWVQEDLDKLKRDEGVFIADAEIVEEVTAPNPFPAEEIPNGDISAGLLYYTDSELREDIADTCRKQLKRCAGDKPIVSVSLKPLDFGNNITVNLERGYLTLFKQILLGLEMLDTDIVYFCEHDILYHPSHFNFIPSRKDAFYYNTNVWKVRMNDGHGLYCDNLQQLSGLCAYRDLLIEHYKKRIKLVEEKGFSRAMGFEPGTHNRDERVDDYKAESWVSELPNIDLRHDGNLTQSRWTKEEFRNQKYTEGWREEDNIPGWGHLRWFWKKASR